MNQDTPPRLLALRKASAPACIHWAPVLAADAGPIKAGKPGSAALKSVVRITPDLRESNERNKSDRQHIPERD